MANDRFREERYLADVVDVVAEDAPRIDPSEALRARLVATLSAETRFAGFVERVARLFDLSLDASRALLARIEEVAGPAWVDGPPGVRLLHFTSGPTLAGAHSGLVHISPGARFPDHLHVGDERVLVLQGVLVEDGNETWFPGDLALRPAGSRHALRCGGLEPVVFIAAVIGGIDAAPASESRA